MSDRLGLNLKLSSLAAEGLANSHREALRFRRVRKIELGSEVIAKDAEVSRRKAASLSAHRYLSRKHTQALTRLTHQIRLHLQTASIVRHRILNLQFGDPLGRKRDHGSLDARHIKLHSILFYRQAACSYALHHQLFLMYQVIGHLPSMSHYLQRHHDRSGHLLPYRVPVFRVFKIAHHEILNPAALPPTGANRKRAAGCRLGLPLLEADTQIIGDRL